MNKLKEDLYIPLHSNIESVRTEICSVASVRRVAAMLDLSPDGLEEKEPLPRGWQFILMAADTKKSQLRADGFPGLGVAMPDLGLPRLNALEARVSSALGLEGLGLKLHLAQEAIMSLTQLLGRGQRCFNRELVGFALGRAHLSQMGQRFIQPLDSLFC